jgi:hypothetical protein
MSLCPREYHWQSGTIEYDLRLSYKVIPPITKLVGGSSKLSSYEHERVIASRRVFRIIGYSRKESTILVNLGIGIPALISSVGAEEDVLDFILTCTRIWSLEDSLYLEMTSGLAIVHLLCQLFLMYSQPEWNNRCQATRFPSSRQRRKRKSINAAQ